MPNIRRILCPLDFSDASDHAFEHALALAGWYGARVSALHVIAPVTVPMMAAGAPPYATQMPVGAAERQRLVALMSSRFAAAGPATPVEAVLQDGFPVQVILECARDADLIVLGTHGASGFEHLLLGSVTEKVLRKAACPVLTVPPRSHAVSRLPYKHVLCAVDFSESSLTGLEHAMALAREADADLTLATVLEWPWEEPPAPPFDELPAPQAASLKEFRAHREREATKRLAALVPADAAEWCSPSLEVVHGKPWVELLKLADSKPADLLVIGIHGRRAVDMAMFGSTTNQVVRRARCPVMTVRT
jgi:nucleotide-binding universal stress UspA family protein